MEFNGHNIPAYDGDPYEVIEDEPCFTSAELIPETSESYGELDSTGRCTSCFAVLNKSIMPTYKRTSSLSGITPNGKSFYRTCEGYCDIDCLIEQGLICYN